MNIFYKRPLALILCITVGGFAIFSLADVVLKLASLIVSLSVLFIGLRIKHLRGESLIIAVAISLIVSIVSSFLYFDIWFHADKRYAGKVNIDATVEECMPINSYTAKLVLKCDNVNDTIFSSYKVIAYLPVDESSRLSEGMIINFNCQLEECSKESRQYLYSKGISAVATDIDDVCVNGTKPFHLPTLLENIREHLSRHITMMSNAESGGLLTALLIGERDKLSPSVQLNFKRIGISHILALSGMHLTLLSAALTKILSIIGVKKKPRLILTTLFIVSYMTLTGFSVSVQRAGFMFILSSALFLLSKTKDSYTSLSSSVFIICVLTPYAIFDIALWLSAFATFGIILLSDYLENKETCEKWWYIPIRWFTVGILSSVFAISATLLISVLTFGGVSILGAFSTLIFSVLTELIMHIGCLMFVVGNIIPIGKIIIPICSFTINLANDLSSLDYVYNYSSTSVSMAFIVILTVLFFGFAVLNIKHKKRYLYSILVVFILCSVLPPVELFFTRTNDHLTYYAEEKSDIFLLSSEGETCLISSGQYSANTAYRILDILEKSKISSLDNLYVTHYSRQLEDELEVVLSNIKTAKLFVPLPQNEDEKDILLKLQSFLSDFSVAILPTENHQSIEAGNYRIKPLYSAPYGEETSMNAFSVSSYTETVCYISSGLLESSKKDEMLRYIKCADQVVLGRHGKKYKKKIYYDECFSSLSRLVINSSNLFLTQDCMCEYDKNGCEVISHPSEVELITSNR